MYGLFITKPSQDLIKVFSNKQKLENAIRDEIFDFINNNKNSILRNRSISRDINLIKECMVLNDFESAMDLFEIVSTKMKKDVILSVADVEIIHDS